MLNKQIHDLIEPTIHSLGLTLWACDMRPMGNQSLLRIYIDRENGVTLEDCARVSREIGAILDVEDPIKKRYQLEVSSPGIERVLSTVMHFQRYVGHYVKLTLRSAVENRRKCIGRIEKVEGNKINLIVENETITVALSDIQKAKLSITDN